MSEREAALKDVVREVRIAELRLPKSVRKHKGLQALWQAMHTLDELEYGKKAKNNQDSEEDAFGTRRYV